MVKYLFQEILPKSIEAYADEVLEAGGSNPSVNALMAKALHLYEVENYVNARDFLIRGIFTNNHIDRNKYIYKLRNIVSAYNLRREDTLCQMKLADTYLKLRAFTSAEYYYVKIKTVNLNYLQSLVYQNSFTKCQEALEIISTFESEHFTDQEKLLLNEIHAK